MEKSGEKSLYRDVTDMRRRKSKARWGWRILIAGIGIEILTAAGFSGYDVWERRQAASRIESIDPLKQPVTTATAFGRLTVTGFDLGRIARDTGSRCTLSFHPRGQFPSAALFEFECSEITVLTSNECTMMFTRSTLSTVFSPPVMDTVEKTIESLDRCTLNVAEVISSPKEFKITGGDVTIVLNSFAKKKFAFPPQQLPQYWNFIMAIGLEPEAKGSRIIWEPTPDGEGARLE
jgi:hypothetical protein